MKLLELLRILPSANSDLNLDKIPDREILKITSNSKETGPGTLFVAVHGSRADGHSFLMEVSANKAAFILGEKPSGEVPVDTTHYLQVPDSRLALGLLASQIENNPSREMLVLGVTGTSGKTTTSYLLESILREAGKKVGLIGTVSFRIDGKEIPSTHTTPGPLELHRLLRSMRDQGCDAVVMEVSSHALKQHRTIGVAFDGALFTNLSAEHLDYHFDMEDYYRAKALLFTDQSILSKSWGKSPVLAVHVGNFYGDTLASEIKSEKFIGFTVASETKIDTTGIRGVFSGLEITSNLLGRFNAENIAGAVALTQALPESFSVSDSAIQRGVKNLTRVPGRLEQVLDPVGGRVVLVDYAHKPDALEKVLEVLRPMRGPGAKLVCLVGCGGDRDRAKRPIMGEIACRLADQVILTSDNPRTEGPESILDEIQKGCAGFSNWKRIVDRKIAIESALRVSKAGDIILIAGKGHEDYQIIGSEKFHFDDREIAAGFLNLSND